MHADNQTYKYSLYLYNIYIYSCIYTFFRWYGKSCIYICWCMCAGSTYVYLHVHMCLCLCVSLYKPIACLWSFCCLHEPHVWLLIYLSFIWTHTRSLSLSLSPISLSLPVLCVYMYNIHTYLWVYSMCIYICVYICIYRYVNSFV